MKPMDGLGEPIDLPDAPAGVTLGDGPGPRGCWALNTAGEPCGATPAEGLTLCSLHRDPEAAVRRGRKGGYRRGLASWVYEGLLDTPADRERFRLEALRALADGRLDEARAKAIATVAGLLAPEAHAPGAALPKDGDREGWRKWLDAREKAFWYSLFAVLDTDANWREEFAYFARARFGWITEVHACPPPPTLEALADEATEDAAWAIAQAWAKRFGWTFGEDGEPEPHDGADREDVPEDERERSLGGGL